MDEELIEEQPNTLDYKPLFERTKKDKTAWASDAIFENEDEAPLTADEDTPAGIGEGLITTIVTIFDEFKSSVIDRTLQLEKELKHETFLIGDKYLSDVEKAKEALGLAPGELTFEDYKEALKQSDTPAGEFLIELIEDQTEDLEGNIKLELYPDYIETLAELELLERYMKKIMLSNLSTNDTLLQGDDWQKELLELEKTWGKQKEAAQTAYDTSYEGYKQAMLYNPQIIGEARGSVHAKELARNQFDTQVNQIAEAILLVKNKIEDTANILYLTDDNLERTPFENGKDVLDSLLVIATGEKEWNESLTNLSLMLKLSVDVSNKEKHHIKTSLRNTYAVKNQEKVVNELSVHDVVFQEKTVPIAHKLSGYQKEQPETMTLLLNQVAVGLAENERQKKQKTKEVFTTMKASSSLRTAKIKQALQKDDARQGYHLMKEIVEQTKQRGLPEVGETESFLVQ